MGMRLWIGTAMLLWPAFYLKAQEAGQCAIKPTCASMGYAQTVTACNGKKMLKCPFDSATVFCGGDACTADYTLNSCDTSKGTCAECGGKYKYTKCSGNYTLSGSVCVCHPDFSLTSCNTSVGPCEKCGSKYRYTSCNNPRWLLSGGNCTEDCGGFPLNDCLSNAYCEGCLGQTGMYFKFMSCKSGYEWNGSSCSAVNPCAGWNQFLSGYQTGYETCVYAGRTYYKETGCKNISATTCVSGNLCDSLYLTNNKCGCANEVNPCL